jgi:acyl carrier protein
VTIRQICASVITDRDIGLDDDFFELGVSSLALAQIHERIDEQFPGQLDVEDLFTKSTIRAVAAHLAERQDAPA